MDRQAQVEISYPIAERRTGSWICAMPSTDAPDAVDPRDEIQNHLAEMRAFALVLARKRALADHIVRRSVVAAWTNIHAFDPGSSMRAWLFRLLRTIYYADRGSQKCGAGKVVDLFKVRDEGECIAEDARFRQAFDALPDEQREAMVLVGPMGFSVAEAAAVSSCTTTTIRNRTRLGRLRLAAIVSFDRQSRG